MGAFSCCQQQHVVHVGNVLHSVPCDKKRIVQVLNSMYNAKVQNLMEVAPGMAVISLGLETMLHAGAEEFAEFLPQSRVTRVKSGSPDNFAAMLGFETVNGTVGGGKDLLAVAVWSYHNEMVRKLLARRVPGEPWHRCDIGATALCVSAGSGNLEAALALFETGEIGDDIVNTPNILGAACLHHAAANGHMELVQLLLRHRAEVNLSKPPFSSTAGRTALHCASATCHAEICQVLLLHRASVHATDAQGVTPLQLAASELPLVIGNQAPTARADTLRCLQEAEGFIEKGH